MVNLIHPLGILSLLLVIIAGILFIVETKAGKEGAGKAKVVLLMIASVLSLPQGFLIFSEVPVGLIFTIAWLVVLAGLIKKDLMKPLIFRIILAIAIIGQNVSHYIFDTRVLGIPPLF